MEVRVLFSENGILALDKPAGICSQGPKTHNPPELCEMVRMHYQGGNIAHRIDRFTSGINLAGVSHRELSYLGKNWHWITKKNYLAVVRNPKWENKKTVSTPIDGKCAVTSFTILDQVWDGSGFTALVKCELVKNGRTHQIRRHLRSIGNPIVGDKVYGGEKTIFRGGQLLHAWRMEVRLPDAEGNQGKWAKIQAPIPYDFYQLGFNWKKLDENAAKSLEAWPVPMNWRYNNANN